MLLVTFSGLDGCGKTTHVARTTTYLAEHGWRVRSLATARISAGGLFSWLSESRKRKRSRSLTTSDQGPRSVDAVEALRPPEDERVQTSPPAREPFQQTRGRWRARAMLCARHFLYPLDCLVLLAWIRSLSLLGYTAVVCDRYIYDKIVNLPHSAGLTARLMRWIAPRPDFAFLIDVTPQAARARRDEHDADYYETKYAAYRRLCGIRRDLRRIPGTTVDKTQHHVEQVIASVGPSPAARSMPQPY